MARMTTTLRCPAIIAGITLVASVAQAGDTARWIVASDWTLGTESVRYGVLRMAWASTYYPGSWGICLGSDIYFMRTWELGVLILSGMGAVIALLGAISMLSRRRGASHG